MAEYYPIVAGFIFLIALAGLASILTRLSLPAIYRRYRLGRLILILMLCGMAFIVIWALGATGKSSILARSGAAMTALAVIFLIALILSVPFSGIVNFVAWIIAKIGGRRIEKLADKPDPMRRRLLEGALLIAPLAAVSAGAGGFMKSFSPATIRRISFEYDDLPEALDSFKILQISDAHLGYYFTLDNLERFVAKAIPLKADMVLVTGDLADDLRLLPQALSLIEELRPRYGIYFCLGNHEYYRGVEEFRRIIGDTSIKLLVNEGEIIPVGDSQIYLGGADDPRWLRRDNSSFLENTVGRAMVDAPENSFRILMTHRPEGFDYASRNKVKLTLAGHTHGGQIGLGGRSIFGLVGYRYLWGAYQNEHGGKLYTTAGMGHWFPFRLGCPPEAPLIELRRI